MSDDWDANRETEQEFSERMHRENDPHYFGDDELFPDADDGDDLEHWEGPCWHCDGSGWARCNDSILMECPECGGDGYV